ncbi:MAG: hypothetical protein ACK5VF_02015 [Bacteroidota bacterium]|jgi:hypothetical protein
MFSSLNHIDNYSLNWPVLHIAFVGGLGSAFAGWREQCRPEAWAVRGSASMPEAPLEWGGIATNVFGVYLRFLANPQFAIKNGFFVFKARAGKIF